MQIDFVSILHGIKSFENLRSDAVRVEFEGYELKVASLDKIIRSKKTLGRPRDLAVIDILERTLDEKRKDRSKQLFRHECGMWYLPVWSTPRQIGPSAAIMRSGNREGKTY